MPNSFDLNLSVRKELYGRTMVKTYRVASGSTPAGTVIRARCCDSHYSDDNGPHHQPALILTMEHVETRRVLFWKIPGDMDSPESWDGYPYIITFDAFDVDSQDAQALRMAGIGDLGQGDLIEEMRKWDLETQSQISKGRVR